MELTLTLHGSLDELRRVIELLDGVEEGRDDRPAGDGALLRFVAIASPPMLATLRAVVDASAQEQAISRASLAEAAGLSGEPELNGVLGSIGRAWARAIGTENPFLGASDAEGGIVYRVDQELADRLGLILTRRESGEWSADHELLHLRAALGRRGGRRRGLGRGRGGRGPIQ